MLLCCVVGGASSGLAQTGTGEPVRIHAHGISSPIGVENPKVFPLKDVKRGITGVGYTVFASERGPEPFKFKVLGVMRGYLGPGEDLIIAQLQGEQIEHTGVISGMSGSPVYVDGRLMGAVGYRFGSFTKRPIAGITPIERMLTAAPAPIRVSASRGHLGLVTSAQGAGSSEHAFSGTLPFGRPEPIDIPMAISGVDHAVLEAMAPMFAERGLQALRTGGGAHQGQWDESSKKATRYYAGGPIAGVLADGDISMAGIGTVTWVHGDRFLAFGHPFRSSGESPIMVSNAHIVTTVASPAGSWKMGQATVPVGMLTDDRLHAIGGTLGTLPPMVPVNVYTDLEGPRRGSDAKPVVSFRTIQSKVETPLLAVMGFANALMQRVSAEEGGTIDVRMTTALSTGQTVVTRYRESEDSSSYFYIPLLMQLLMDLDSLVKHGLEPVELQSVDFHVNRVADVRLGAVSGLRLNGDLMPGETIQLSVQVKKWKGGRQELLLPVALPADLTPGQYRLVVATSLSALSMEEDAGLLGPVNSVDQLIQSMENRPQPGTLSVYLQGTDRVLQWNGEAIPQLPTSIQNILDDGTGAIGGTLDNRLLRIARISSPIVMRGVQALKIHVEPSQSWSSHIDSQ